MCGLSAQILVSVTVYSTVCVLNMNMHPFIKKSHMIQSTVFKLSYCTFKPTVPMKHTWEMPHLNWVHWHRMKRQRLRRVNFPFTRSILNTDQSKQANRRGKPVCEWTFTNTRALCLWLQKKRRWKKPLCPPTSRTQRHNIP